MVLEAPFALPFALPFPSVSAFLTLAAWDSAFL